MRPYLVFARFPKNPNKFINNFKKIVLAYCLKNGVECVVERLTGRILIFSSIDICEFVKTISRVEDCRPVKIYQNEDEIVSEAIKLLENCKNFAVRCNKLHVAQSIGARIHEILGIPANLENPECPVNLEFRDGYYLLIL